MRTAPVKRLCCICSLNYANAGKSGVKRNVDPVRSAVYQTASGQSTFLSERETFLKSLKFHCWPSQIKCKEINSLILPKLFRECSSSLQITLTQGPGFGIPFLTSQSCLRLCFCVGVPLDWISDPKTKGGMILAEKEILVSQK